jgi:hypothetical protein
MDHIKRSQNTYAEREEIQIRWVQFEHHPLEFLFQRGNCGAVLRRRRSCDEIRPIQAIIDLELPIRYYQWHRT